MELIGTHLTEAGIAHQIVGDPTLFDVIFSERPVRDYRDVLQADAGRNAAFNKALRGAGVFKSPGKLYPSLAIDDQDLEWTDRRSARPLQKSGWRRVWYRSYARHFASAAIGGVCCQEEKSSPQRPVWGGAKRKLSPL
jgi:hypothetical protein